MRTEIIAHLSYTYLLREASSQRSICLVCLHTARVQPVDGPKVRCCRNQLRLWVCIPSTVYKVTIACSSWEWKSRALATAQYITNYGLPSPSPPISNFVTGCRSNVIAHIYSLDFFILATPIASSEAPNILVIDQSIHHQRS